MQTPQPIHFAKTTWENDSLYSTQFNDIYFSTAGGRKESNEVYLQGNKLEERFSNCQNFVIGEVGFGTTLNFALTLELWKKRSKPDARLFYLAYEKYPLESLQIEQVLRSQNISEELISSIINKLPLPVESLHLIDLPECRARLYLFYGDALEKLQETRAQVDAWFLDGFSPSKNPELWSPEILKEVSRLSYQETTAATFSVSSVVKEGLKNQNWEIEKISGGGTKKQVLNATFKGAGNSTFVKTTPKVCVVGGGLSGCALANSFSRRGALVTLFEGRNGLAQAASGNELGIVLPYPSRGRDIPHRFFTASFLYLNSVLKKYGIGSTGVLFQPLKDRDGEFFEDYSKYEYPKEFAQIVSPTESSELSGIKIVKSNLYYPLGGTVSFPQLCQRLVENSGVITLAKQINSLSDLAGEFDIVLLASGSNFEVYPEMISSFLHPLKGEVGAIIETEESKKLKIPVCDKGIICPSNNGSHVVGSTYQRGLSDEELSETGEEELGKVFNGLFPEDVPKFLSRRAAVRVACKDRMPVVGEVKSEIEGARVFVSTAHGSRGGVSALMSAEVLAARVFEEPEVLEWRLGRGIGVERIGRR